MSAHTVQWVTASPLWPATLNGGLDPATEGRRMRAPAILRFERDSFMDDLGSVLAQDPAALDDLVATKVTYRLPAPGETAPPPPPELKLFQAAHGHFCLVTASLTCRLPGLPDHDVKPAASEQVAFVLRRRDDAGMEWAWASDTSVVAGRTWAPIAPGQTQALTSGEELLPLFPVNYQAAERRRTVFVGLVPTSSADTFKAVGQLSPLAPPGDGAGAAPADPRPAALATKVTGPLRALAGAPTSAPDDITDPAARQAIAQAERDTLVQASRFLLVDFAEFLIGTLPVVWEALIPGRAAPGGTARALYDALTTRRADPAQPTTWSDALRAAWDTRLVLFGDDPSGASLPAPLNLAGSALTADALDALVAAALGPYTAADGATSIQGDTVPPPQAPKLDPQGRWSYTLRCVYRRPECAPLVPDVVSEPSEPFQIAGFFDLDAPSRPIFISLPISTGIGDLRKMRKSVNLLISNQLRAQMNRVTNLNDALKGQFADGDTFDLGLICSFSIPIITICALLVLMIFIQLLNIVFWWLPFLRICFPIALKGGES